MNELSRALVRVALIGFCALAMLQLKENGALAVILLPVLLWFTKKPKVDTDVTNHLDGLTDQVKELVQAIKSQNKP